MLLLFVGIISVGYYMTDLPLGPRKLKIYALHKSIGLTLLGLAALRLLWRLGERRPALPPMPAWQARAATATHVLLYGLMFADSAVGLAVQLGGGLSAAVVPPREPAAAHRRRPGS